MQKESNRVVIDPVLSDPATDGTALARALAEQLSAKIDTMLVDLRRMTAHGDISFVQRSALQEADSLMTQARFILGLAKK